MSKYRLLDLFCGAGGCTKGYQRAGFYVVGVDMKPQPNYCGEEFLRHDALDILDVLASGGTLGDNGWQLCDFDAIHASPPCQAYAVLATTRKRDDHPDLLGPTRELLKATGLPYAIENVPTAPMPEGILLCGSTFGLPVVRHRLFEIEPRPLLVPSACHQRRFSRSVDHGPAFHPYARGTWEPAWREHVIPTVWPWMTLEEAGQAIPPDYTEWIGRHFVTFLDNQKWEAA